MLAWLRNDQDLRDLNEDAGLGERLVREREGGDLGQRIGKTGGKEAAGGVRAENTGPERRRDNAGRERHAKLSVARVDATLEDQRWPVADERAAGGGLEFQSRGALTIVEEKR